MIGIAAAVILVIGGVAFTMMGKKPVQQSEPTVAEQEMEAEFEATDEQDIDAPVVDEEDETPVALAEQVAVTEETARNYYASCRTCPRKGGCHCRQNDSR